LKLKKADLKKKDQGRQIRPKNGAGGAHSRQVIAKGKKKLKELKGQKKRETQSPRLAEGQDIASRKDCITVAKSLAGS